MSKTSHDYERVTISLPSEISRDIDEMKKELNISKSELFKTAFEIFLREHRKQKIRKIAERMTKDYETDKELTAFTALDSEDFR
ncbi:MAG: ribbon-helix-helix protein, CopG family [Nitrospira sp.]|nr:ribbon-helix-helix protein, CopG family [Nitrospira sp.]